jgi:cell division protein FtsL
MNRSRRKKFNTIDAASLARWIVITTFFALTGLIYVYRTIQLHDLATEKDRLEKEIVAVRKERDVASDQIAALTSRSALQRRLKEGYITMIPIAEHNIVRLSGNEIDTIRPVANQNAGK